MSNKIKETYLVKLPFKGSTQSIVYYYDDGANRVLYTDGKTVEQVMSEEPDLVEWTNEEYTLAWNEHLKTLVSDAIPVTEEYFNEMLNVLPPSRWSTVDGINSFHMSENLTGELVSWYAKVANRYFTFVDSQFITKDEVSAKVQAALTYKD